MLPFEARSNKIIAIEFRNIFASIGAFERYTLEVEYSRPVHSQGNDAEKVVLSTPVTETMGISPSFQLSHEEDAREFTEKFEQIDNFTCVFRLKIADPGKEKLQESTIEFEVNWKDIHFLSEDLSMI